MNRRDVLRSTSTAGLVLVPGCSAIADRETGRTYALEITGPIDEPTEEVLNYDRSGLTRSQEQLVEEAIRTGSYRESNVHWNTGPGREGITMEFRLLVQIIAEHVGRDTQVDHETTFETPSAYEGTTYRSVVDVD